MGQVYSRQKPPMTIGVLANAAAPAGVGADPTTLNDNVIFSLLLDAGATT